jgi:hypothetical protein
MFTGKKAAEQRMSKQLKNKSPTECDKREVKRERVSLSVFGTPKAKTINERERPARQSEIMIFFPFNTSLLNITKETARESHSTPPPLKGQREREKENKGGGGGGRKSKIGLLFKSCNVQGINWCGV